MWGALSSNMCYTCYIFLHLLPRVWVQVKTFFGIRLESFPLPAEATPMMNQWSYFFLINLFIFGSAGSSLLHAAFLLLQWAGASLCCSPWASHCGGFSCCGADSRHPDFSRCSTQALEYGSVVVVHRLSYFEACAIFPDQGLNPCPLHCQADSYPLYHQGSPLILFLSAV